MLSALWCAGQGATVGGVWVYTDQIEDDTLGTDPNRRRVHTSMYANLRTNLPREVRLAEVHGPKHVAKVVCCLKNRIRIKSCQSCCYLH